MLVERDLRKLDPDARSSILQEWWTVSEVDNGYETLPDDLKEHLKSTDKPERPEDPFYDPLVCLRLVISYIGAQNSYLEEEVSKLTQNQVTVTGDPERLYACPCCRYRTLELRAEYDICRVCFWEDSGTSDPEDMSPPNRMKLGDAQRNFELFGACERRALEFTDKDGPRKYPRAASAEPPLHLYEFSGRRCPCCDGQGELIFKTCRKCGLLTLECSDVGTVFPSPRKLDPTEGISIERPCPNCQAAMGYMRPATSEEIQKAGFSESEFR